MSNRYITDKDYKISNKDLIIKDNIGLPSGYSIKDKSIKDIFTDMIVVDGVNNFPINIKNLSIGIQSEDLSQQQILQYPIGAEIYVSKFRLFTIQLKDFQASLNGINKITLTMGDITETIELNDSAVSKIESTGLGINITNFKNMIITDNNPIDLMLQVGNYSLKIATIHPGYKLFSKIYSNHALTTNIKYGDYIKPNDDNEAYVKFKLIRYDDIVNSVDTKLNSNQYIGVPSNVPLLYIIDENNIKQIWETSDLDKTTFSFNGNDIVYKWYHSDDMKLLEENVEYTAVLNTININN